MAIWDTISDLYDSLTSSFVTEAHADAPEEDSGQVEGDEAQEGEEISKTEEVDEGGDGDGGDGGEEGGDEEGGDDEEEEEEEEEEEPEDPKPRLEEECSRSAQCIGYKHHFDECVERVTSQEENPDHKGPKENCVEEFFHLQHCATQCAAPKLFKQLK